MTWWIYPKRFIDCTLEEQSAWDEIMIAVRVGFEHDIQI